jgi:hypothetical protein
MPMPVTKDPALLARRTSNALDRLDQVEKTIPQLVSAINNSLGGLHQQVNSQGEVVEALVQLLGKETVESTIRDTRERRATEAMEAEKKALEELKGRGDLAAVEKVTEKSVIVGREYNPDGTVRHPGRAQVAFQRVDESFKTGLLNQPVGFILELPNKGKFEVVEIYEVVEKPAPAPEAPAEAAAETPPAPTAETTPAPAVP